MTWQRIEKSDFGYAIHMPQGWDERQPNLKNSPWETARFVQTTDRRHSVVMFRHPIRPGRSATDVAETVQETLRAAGFEDFQVSDAEVAGRSGARLDCLRRDAGRVWAVREYFVVTEGVSFCVGCGTAVPEEDDHLFAEIAERLELLDLDLG